MESLQNNSSPFYNETIIEQLRHAIAAHLSLLLSDWYRYMPEFREKLLIHADWVIYSDLENQVLKTPQIAIILLEVADFLFKNQWEANISDIESKIINIPHSYTKAMKAQSEIGWLFWEVPILSSFFCLSQVFNLLKWKLIERQTGLFHVLFLKTCLMLEEQGVPPDFLLWNEYSSLSWLDLVKWYLIENWNDIKSILIDAEWIEKYPKLTNEIAHLYERLSITRIELHKLNISNWTNKEQ